jgi:hypothetical protein
MGTGLPKMKKKFPRHQFWMTHLYCVKTKFYIFFRTLVFYCLGIFIHVCDRSILTSLHGLEELAWSFLLLSIISGLLVTPTVNLFFETVYQNSYKKGLIYKNN